MINLSPNAFLQGRRPDQFPRSRTSDRDIKWIPDYVNPDAKDVQDSDHKAAPLSPRPAFPPAAASAPVIIDLGYTTDLVIGNYDFHYTDNPVNNVGDWGGYV